MVARTRSCRSCSAMESARLELVSMSGSLGTETEPISAAVFFAGLMPRAILSASSSFALYSLHRFLKCAVFSCSFCSLRVSSLDSSSSSAARCSAANRRAAVGAAILSAALPPSLDEAASVARFAASSALANRARVCLCLVSLASSSFLSLRFSFWRFRYRSSSIVALMRAYGEIMKAPVSRVRGRRDGRACFVAGGH